MLIREARRAWLVAHVFLFPLAVQAQISGVPSATATTLGISSFGDGAGQSVQGSNPRLPVGVAGGALGSVVADVLGNISGESVIAAFSPAARSERARAADVRNIQDWIIPTDNGNYSLALTRLCNTVSGDFQVYYPGTTAAYNHTTSVTTCGGRNIWINGDGVSVTKLNWTGSGVLFDITQSDVTQTIRLSNMAISSTSASGSLAALRVTYPIVASSNRPTLEAYNVDVVSPTSGALSGSFCKAIMVLNAWNVRIEDIQFTAQAVQPASKGCAMVDASNTRDISISRASQTYGDALFYQSGYDEGIHLDHPTVVGTNWIFNQNSATITPGATEFGVGMTVSYGEINTYLGGFNLQHWHSAGMNNNHFTRWGSGTGTLTGYNLSDVTALRASNDVFDGGAASGNITYAKLTAGTVSTTDNIFIAPEISNTGVLANFGINTYANSLLEARNQSNAAVEDWGGGGNIVEELTGSGHHKIYEPVTIELPNGAVSQSGQNTNYFRQDIVLSGTTVGGSGTRLTSDGLAASSANCINIPPFGEKGVRLTIVGRSATQHFAYDMPLVELSRDTSGSTADTTTIPQAGNLAPTVARDSGSGTTVYVAPDNINKCIQIIVGPSTGEVWNYTASATVTNYQP